MKKFHFRLRVLEEVRKKKQDQALMLFSESQAEYLESIRQKEALEQALSASLQRREDLHGVAVPASMYIAEDAFIQGTKKRIEHAELQILRSKKKMEKAFKHYMESRRKHREMELLEEKQKSEHQRKQRKLEQKAQDEIYILSRGRQSKALLVASVLLGLGMASPSFAADESKSDKTKSIDTKVLSGKCLVNRDVIKEVTKQKEDIGKKLEELAKKETELQQREAALQEQMNQLKKIRDEIGLGRAEEKKAFEGKVAKVVETMEKMSPKAVSSLLASLDTRLAVEAMRQLSSARLAKVMNIMDPKKASELTEVMTLGDERSPAGN